MGPLTAPTLETPRLTLRALSLGDWDAYAAAWADARMTTFIGGEPRDRTTSWGKFVQGIGLWPLFGFGFWSFVERETGAFVGNGGLARFERGLPELEQVPEAGWAFVPDAWGKGYATEAMTAILHWADRSVDAPEIRCIIDPGNVASHRVATKLGFEQFATSDKPLGRINIYRRMAP